MPPNEKPAGLKLTPREHYEKIPKRDSNQKLRPISRLHEPLPTLDPGAEQDFDSLEHVNIPNRDSNQGAEQDSDSPEAELSSTAILPSEPQLARSMAPSIGQGFGQQDNLEAQFNLLDYLPTPGNQGDETDCVAWAIAHAAYTCQLAQERRRKRPTLKSDLFSPAFIYDKLNNSQGELNALQVINELKGFGCASEATMEPNSNASEFAEARNFKLLRNERADNLDDLKSYLCEGYPVILIVRMGEGFRDDSPSDRPYVWKDDRPIGENYHAVAAVGYNDATESVLIMNSWGTNWKGDGFCEVAYSNFDEIDDRHWCAEAHIAGVKRIAPYNVWLENSSAFSRFGRPSRFRRPRFNRRVFQLEADRKVYEGDELFSPPDWEIDNIACNDDTLFVLLRDQTVRRMDDRHGQKWTPLDSGEMAGKKVTMLAADESDSLHALTSEHKLMQYNTERGWSRANLPADAGDVADVRLLQGDVHATTVDGFVYVRDRFDRWSLVT